ncbi:hypothetical protein E2562_003171 [Oryza meyeriana var. granulata]|uniref:Uncharacterized protein n=1 Tax=Oryza meyeriana var. granulata TaxID=110450 RepID=A0A6G1EUS3_9ORYZ|nr:hypothetical protein E2562_003171 [Oryza meyeriana var. granulata]
MASRGRGGGGGGGNGDKWKPAWLLELVLAIPAMSSRKPLLVACVGDRWVWEVVGMWRGGEGWGVGGGGSAVQPQHEQAAGIGVSPLFAGGNCFACLFPSLIIIMLSCALYHSNWMR